MRASDLTPEERWAHEKRVAETIARADAANARLAECAERREADGSALAERAEARQREERERAASEQPKPVPPAPRPPQRDWQAERRWVAQIVDKEIGPLAEEIGRVCASTDNRLDRLEERMAASDQAVVELLREMEERLARLEERAITKPAHRPRLVGGGDDAA
jgi:hypothetical protein